MTWSLTNTDFETDQPAHIIDHVKSSEEKKEMRKGDHKGLPNNKVDQKDDEPYKGHQRDKRNIP